MLKKSLKYVSGHSRRVPLFSIVNTVRLNRLMSSGVAERGP